MINSIGKKARLLRHQRGWSQEDVARQLRISIPAYSKIETGITDINLSRLEQLAALFNLSAVQLLMYGETMSNTDDELMAKNKALIARDAEMIILQEKVIALYEEIRRVSKAV